MVSSRQVSTAPLAVQRRAPWVQLVAQAAHAPPEQKVFARHRCGGPHTGQLFASVPQVSSPLPLQRTAPLVQLVPQVPQAPPEQKVVQLWLNCHEVQPLASATQVSTFRPVHRVAPAVQVVLQAEHAPLAHTLPEGQLRDVHCVHPEMTFHWHSSTPDAVHRDAPMAQPWQLEHWVPLHTSP